MNIIHRILVNESDIDITIEYKRMSQPLKCCYDLLIFEFSESDPNWKFIEEIIKKYDSGHTVRTEFSLDELYGSSYLEVVPSWHLGYPQPEKDFGYMAVTYDLSRDCDVCHVGMKQKAPFRIKKEPAWGRKSIMQLNWRFDEYFVKPEVWEEIFKPFGIACRPVLHHKTGEILQTVVQLDVTEMVSVDVQNATFEDCQKCGVRKYHPVTRGLSPGPLEKPQSAMFKSRQSFGSRGREFKNVYVTNELYRVLAERKILGVEFRACTP